VKIKAVFELKVLTANFKHSDDILTEAIKCSAMAMNIIQSFFGTIENKCNEREFKV